MSEQEFKYAHQLDETVMQKAPRSRFDLICGVLLGGLAFGLVMPAAKHWVETQAFAPHSMAAKSMVVEPTVAPAEYTNSIKVKDKDKDKEQETLAADTATVVEAETLETVETATPELAPRAIPAPVRKNPMVKAKTVAKTPVKESPRAVAAAVEPLEEKKLNVPKTSLAVAAAAPKPAAPSRAVAVLSETEIPEGQPVMSAQDVAVKTDASLITEEAEPTAVVDEKTYITIYNAQYQKDALTRCKTRCLVKSKDPNGVAINAIVSGPNFADILLEHEGTINITGVKRMIKKHELFMVQSITFNLPPQKAVAQAKPAIKPSNLRLSNFKARAAAPIPEPAYEDLSVDSPSSH